MYRRTMDQELANTAAYVLGDAACDVIPEIRLSESKRIYLKDKDNLAQFNPDLIWNDGALSYFEDSHPNKKKNKNNKNKTSSD